MGSRSLVLVRTWNGLFEDLYECPYDCDRYHNDDGELNWQLHYRCNRECYLRIMVVEKYDLERFLYYNDSLPRLRQRILAVVSKSPNLRQHATGGYCQAYEIDPRSP